VLEDGGQQVGGVGCSSVRATQVTIMLHVTCKENIQNAMQWHMFHIAYVLYILDIHVTCNSQTCHHVMFCLTDHTLLVTCGMHNFVNTFGDAHPSSAQMPDCCCVRVATQSCSSSSGIWIRRLELRETHNTQDSTQRNGVARPLRSRLLLLSPLW